MSLSLTDGDTARLRVRPGPRKGRGLSSTDGRVERSRRTREALVESFIALLITLGRAPTVPELSDHSGRSMRIIFDRFQTLDALASAAVLQLLAPPTHEVLHRVAGMTRAGRLAFHLESRRQACERLRPAWPIIVEKVRKDTTCAAQLGLLQQVERGQMAALYGPELRSLGEAKRDRLLLDLDVLLGIETWICLRERHRLHADEAVDFWRAGVERILADPAA